MIERIHVVVMILAAGLCAAAQEPPGESIPEQPVETMPAQAQAPAQELHWSQHLGLKINQIDETIPTVDCVVLVPDAATYLDEISRWTTSGHWPVLIEDSKLSTLFIRRFKPSKIIRRESVGALPEADELRQRIERAVLNAFGGTADDHSVREMFKQNNWIPPGLVITSLQDPAWTAAVALAAGRGQPIAYLDGDFRTADSAPLTTELDPLADAITREAAALGYAFDKFGDELDVVTVCRQMGGRIRVQKGADATRDVAYLAITDGLGRLPDGNRYAIVGWIFGSEVRSAYVAMCSLFLPRENVLMVNTYPLKEHPWTVFATKPAAELLVRQGYRPSESSGTSATENVWLRSLAGGLSADLAMINTRGREYWFMMFDEERCHAADIPVLNAPIAVHFIHSWSMVRPEDTATIAGRWLDHGAYAYIGSVEEPGLTAFVPPVEVARRLAGFVPLLIAARHWDQPVWRVNMFGDPLMIAPPPRPRPRQPAPEPFDRGVDLKSQVRELMVAAQEDPSGKAYQPAMETLVLLGEDDIAIGLWQHAMKSPGAVYSARAALGPLFRKDDARGFLEAWALLPSRDDLALDMLWHMFSSRLATLHADSLLQLQGAIRKPMADADVERLMPHVQTKFGASQAAQLLQREIDTAVNDSVRRRLEALRAR